MTNSKVWQLATVALAVALLGILLREGIAQTASLLGGNGVAQVKVVRSSDLFSTDDSIVGVDYHDLPGASTKITVPSGKQALVVARFSAEARCYQIFASPPENACFVRILIGGLAGAPAGGDASFAHNNNGNDNDALAELRFIERSGYSALVPIR